MKYITEHEALKRYNQAIDENNEAFKFGWMNYKASDVIKEVDPSAYAKGLCDWLEVNKLEISYTIAEEGE